MIHQTLASYDGEEIHVYRSDFSEQKPNVILVLPFGLRAEVSAALFDVLAGHFNVLTWRARRLLDAETEPCHSTELNVGMHVEDLRHVLQYFCIKKSNVLGYCSGAGIALLAAAEFSELFENMVLVCGEYMLPPDVCARTKFQQDVDNILPLAANSRVYASALSEKLMSQEIDMQSEFQADVMLPFSRPEYLYRHGLNYLQYRGIDFREAAQRNPLKTLLISTSNDRQVPPRSSEIIAAAIGPNATHVTLPGDHYEILRGSSQAVRVLLDFLLPNEELNERAA